jgi:hypothetical protein
MCQAQKGEVVMNGPQALKRSKERSPSFPFISLPKAVSRAQEFAKHYRRVATRLNDAAQAWGYKPKSSGLLQTVAALKAFGLVTDFGSGPDRKIELTDLAWRIIHDDRPGERDRALREAALRPKLISEFARGVWRDGRPPDNRCISELTLERGFTRDAAATFLRVYDATIDYTGLQRADKLPDSERSNYAKNAENGNIEVGDVVQWAPGGVMQFPHGRRVRALSDDGQWAFVDGSETGLPMAELEVLEKPRQDPPRLPLGSTSPLAEERQFLHGPLGSEVEYRLLVSGDVGPKEIGKLIRILQLQKELLEDSE